ncbi:disulfide bond formation protein B [Helicobacter pametensis]|uniref:disulfide bond formation protein DsbI n=1 Tax=Helicobacter pametensis TaxID=95149 RepID=UPI000489538F|nr:disulfide bond formation protein B [Helicobacter pametensis]
MQEKNARLFYTLMCLAGFFIILIPVGIANLVFGYMLGDSPCTSCWGQRESMIYIGSTALFIVRYGLKPRYISFLLIATAFALWQSFNHIAWHAIGDLDQGFSLLIFGMRSYVWAEVVFWCVVLFLGVMFAFAPRLSELEVHGAMREVGGAARVAFLISALIVGSNAFQAFVSTGIPPFVGQGNPVRFTLDPKYIIWSSQNWKKFFTDFSVLGVRDVKDPDYAFAPSSKLGISFTQKSDQSPFERIDYALKIKDEKVIKIDAPLNTLSEIYGEYIVSSKHHVYFLSLDSQSRDLFELDPYFSSTINPIIGIIPYMSHKYLLMGSNKTYLRFQKNAQANERLQYADFIKGANAFEGQGEGLGRGKFLTVRAKFHHILSIATDGKYIYTATVPNNKDKKTFVISAFLSSDLMLSREFTPTAHLKNGRSLGDLYVTGMSYYGGKLYALSKNYNVIAVIDPIKEQVVKTISFPETIKNARGIVVKKEGIEILSYQDGANLLFTLQ